MPSKKGFQGLMDMAINQACLSFGKDFNTSDDGNWYKLIAPLILACSYLEDKIISREMAANIYTAKGEDLDNLLSNDLFYRNKGNFAEGLCNVIGENDIYIPTGSITILGKNNKYYKNIEPGTIKNKTLKIKFKALEMGTSCNLLQNMIETVEKAPQGVLDVQNEAINGGLDEETDMEFMKRYFDSSSSLTWNLEAILCKIRELKGVVSCDGRNNNTMEEGHNGLPKKSIRIVVDGGDEQEIAETIYNNIHTPNTIGSIAKKVRITPTLEDVFRFDRPKTTRVDYKYNIISPQKERILELLKEYLSEGRIGDFISSEMFRKAKNIDLDYELKLLQIQFKKSTDSSYSDFIQMNYDEKSTVGNGVSV